MESLTLTVAQSVASYQVLKLTLNWAGARIKVILKDPIGDIREFGYDGTAATNLMVALNKANLSVQSLHSRILSQLVTDGKLPAGTVTGTPD